MENFTIDRRKWLSGKTVLSKVDSCLYDEATGLQCCLGQYLVKHGMTPAQLHNAAMPSAVSHGAFPDAALWLLEAGSEGVWRQNSKLAARLQEANDDGDVTTLRREAKLVALFAKADVKVKFTGSAAVARKKARQLGVTA